MYTSYWRLEDIFIYIYFMLSLQMTIEHTFLCSHQWGKTHSDDMILQWVDDMNFKTHIDRDPFFNF